MIRIFFRLRTRILAAYIMLMALFAVIPIVAVRQVLFARLEARIEKALIQEIQEFRRLVYSWQPSPSRSSEDNIATIFDVFLSRNVPSKNEFYITLLNGQFYKSSSKTLPTPLQPNTKSRTDVVE